MFNWFGSHEQENLVTVFRDEGVVAAVVASLVRDGLRTEVGSYSGYISHVISKLYQKNYFLDVHVTAPSACSRILHGVDRDSELNPRFSSP
jgi:hypothetical protein